MRHIPVLLAEVIESLQLKVNDNVIDCTLGDGGHAEHILKQTVPNGKLLGIDADAESLLRAKKFLHDFEDRVVFVRDNFANLKKIVKENGWEKINGILLDLGWSSPQFEERGRGFSFQKDEPLDMRYNSNASGPTAAELLNNLSETELEKIFRQFGEEKNSKKIAREITKFRQQKEIKTTGQLVEIITKINQPKGKIHPATRVFQALRIAVNNELEILKRVLPDAIAVLDRGGRLAVITFHSLEDAIVKHYFKKNNNKILKIINKKPVRAGQEEIERNRRGRAAKLRGVEKI